MEMEKSAKKFVTKVIMLKKLQRPFNIDLKMFIEYGQLFIF